MQFCYILPKCTALQYLTLWYRLEQNQFTTNGQTMIKQLNMKKPNVKIVLESVKKCWGTFFQLWCFGILCNWFNNSFAHKNMMGSDPYLLTSAEYIWLEMRPSSDCWIPSAVCFLLMPCIVWGRRIKLTSLWFYALLHTGAPSFYDLFIIC